MKPIRIISPDFELLGEISDYESLIFEPKWHTYGEFELRINRYKKYTDTLKEDNLIIIGGNTSKVGVIRHKEIELNEDGKLSENWIVRGDTLGGILERRLTVPPNGGYDRLTAPVETVIKQYVSNNTINQGDRSIPQLEVAADQVRGEYVRDQTRYKPLVQEVERLSILSGLGWNIHLDYPQHKWVFDVYEGTDRTTSQTDVPPVIFATKFGNIETAEYMVSTFNFKNVIYVAGQGEGADRLVVEHGTGEGLKRYETFVDARDVANEDDNGDPVPVEEVEAQLIGRAEQELSETNVEEYFEARITNRPGFEYQKNWDLGDIVTVKVDDWGITGDFRITGVREITEASRPDAFEVVFGTEQPSFMDKLDREFAQFQNEIRK